MDQRLRIFPLLIALATLGCAGSPFASPTPPKPTPKKVTIDAQWSSDEPNEELLRLIKQKEVPARDSGTPYEPPDQRDPHVHRDLIGGDRNLDWQHSSEPRPAVRATQAPTIAASQSQSQSPIAPTEYFEPAEPAPPGRPVVSTLSASPTQPTRSTQEVTTFARTSAAPRSGERSYSESQSATSTSNNFATKPLFKPLFKPLPKPQPSRQPSSLVVGAASSRVGPPAVSVKGVVADGLGQSLAMLQLDGGDTVVAREGDTFDIGSGQEITSVQVLRISDRSVSVQFGGQSKVVVLR